VPKTTLEKPVTMAAREFVLIRNRPGESDYEHSAAGRCRRADNGLPRPAEVA
jgi:hypothetical protein